METTKIEWPAFIKRRGIPRWILHRCMAGDSLCKITVPKTDAAPKLEYFGFAAATEAEGALAPNHDNGLITQNSLYWRQQRKVLLEFVHMGLLVRSNKTKRADGSTVETFGLTEDARLLIKASLPQLINFIPPDVFNSEAAIRTALLAEKADRVAAYRDQEERRQEQIREKLQKPRVRHAVTHNDYRDDYRHVRLFIELVPKPLWGENLRKFFVGDDWNTLRAYIYKRANGHCEGCGDRSARLECHEIWHYDDEKHVQSFSGCCALCADCHHIKHIGLSEVRADKGELDFDKLIAHYCRVNDCDSNTFYLHRAQAMGLWHRRSSYTDWTVDWRAGDELLAAAKRAAETTNPPTPVAMWTMCYSENRNYPAQTERGGKWLVFSPAAEHEQWWRIIEAATREGQLGRVSKAYASDEPMQYAPGMKAICVYTYDGDDEEDVMRVRQALHKLGITWKIYWKPDAATRANLYSGNGKQKVTRYAA